MTGAWPDVRERLTQRTDRVLGDLHAEYGTDTTLEPLDYGPKPWYPDQPPDSIDGQLDTFAGMASVVTFHTDRRHETVLVYNRAGHWEPPGGAVEGRDALADTAAREAAEEAGITVAITDLCYTRRVHYHYDDGSTATLPVATFVGHRVEGSLSVEREQNDHPGVTRAVGLFTPDVLPENCRDRERILELLPDEDERSVVPNSE
jgi:8-oxo-dGTP pyrophosphatase MutT (NUDIX family)